MKVRCLGCRLKTKEVGSFFVFIDNFDPNFVTKEQRKLKRGRKDSPRGLEKKTGLMEGCEGSENSMGGTFIDSVSGEKIEKYCFGEDANEVSSSKGKGLWKKVKFKLVEFHSLLGYLRDNEFILGHYQSEWPLKQVFLSMFTVHNETLNVWIASVFGVSTESMQCSYDSRGNSIPTILLLMQRSLYSQGGLRAEGIFRINAENSQEEHVRHQLNMGTVPDGIDVHCLAGLIKAWFRELPSGVLDSLTPEQVMQCQSEEECAQLARLLPVTEAALLDWAINLMVDVVLEEQQNKMNARNIAMVFAPNMTQMADPLTALMHAVQVMNFLKTLILRTLREREESGLDSATPSHCEPSDENGHQSPSQSCLETHKTEETNDISTISEPVLDDFSLRTEEDFTVDDRKKSFQTYNCSSEESTQTNLPSNGSKTTLNFDFKTRISGNVNRKGTGNLNNLNHRKGQRKFNGQSLVRVTTPAEKSRGVSIVSRINSRVGRVEAWR